MSPCVSIIMPVFNGERFITKAIDSVLTQSMQDWELIVVDDGSTDDTPSLLRDYSDQRISIICQRNQGEATARNVGLANATGDYISFLDADDLYLPEALNDLAQFLKKHPDVDSVYSEGYFCDEHGRLLMRLSDHRIGFHTGTILEHLVLSPSIITFPVCTMTRRLSIERFGISFDTSLGYGTDWDFWIQLARYGKYGYLDKPTCKYRVHQMSMTRTTHPFQRHNDLVRGRLKVMNSEWFHKLSLSTREEFFYNLLVGFLADSSIQQMDICQSLAFQSLPNQSRAHLFRLIATDYLLRGCKSPAVQTFLHQALLTWPEDKKSIFLMALIKMNITLGVKVVRLWNFIHQTLSVWRSIGHRKPKPIPEMLLSSCDVKLV